MPSASSSDARHMGRNDNRTKTGLATAEERSTPEARMAALARTFPCTSKAAGVDLWTARTFDGWATDPSRSRSERVTAQFLLAVWDQNFPWRCGGFGRAESLRVWDEEHRRAFLVWEENPWRGWRT